MKTLFLIILAVCCFIPAYSQLTVSALFTDHMVVQRDHPINIWGKASPGQSVSVNVSGNSRTSKADMDGHWMVTFPATPAGGPYQMKITSGGESISFADIFVGDVWLCSGQSNMEWTVQKSNDPDKAIMNATDAMIRHFKVPHTTANAPDEELEGGPWQINNTETVSDFTAVGYYFAQTLRKHQDVPIGLLNSSWGGSRIEPWMSAEALEMKDPETYLENYENAQQKEMVERLKQLQKKFPGLRDKDQGMRMGKPIWHAESIEDSNWERIEVPAQWEDQGYQGVDGIAWYRNIFELNKMESTADIMLHLAKIDDSDQVWVNGQYVGGMESAYATLREYKVDSDLIKQGKNTIAIRVEDTGGGGGIYGEVSDVFIRTAQRKISLAGKWRFKLGALKAYQTNSSANHIPMLLYNKMIHPVLNFPIKGVIWYQGESNAGNDADASKYESLFKTMIEQWRSDWGIGDFPFLFVQLANYRAADGEPKDSPWALLRESQSSATLLPNVGEAVIIDIGEADDIHPRNKQDVGWRLAQAARKLAYGEDVVYHGPVYQNHTKDGKHIRLEFDQDLVVKDKYGYVKGFAIAGSDGKFRWAKAIANGNKITVWNDNINNPQHVRYAWGDNPDDVNLYNKEGMPARPFRTGK